MFRMGRLRSLAAVIAASAAALAVAPAADAAGPIQSGLATPVAVTTLKPGVTLTVNAGPGQAKVPSVTGLDLAAAEAQGCRILRCHGRIMRA